MEDIVLDTDKIAQLQEACNYARYRYQVHHEWGFARKFSLGHGLCFLFSGNSGTGKTMATEIIANELGLELYKIDHAALVSKYVGESEKHIRLVFDEFQSGSAIILFDEADALFGKRTEIKDSHDRYANLETNFLLQKIEEYQGIVILATNLLQNIDPAFLRRMHFVIDFPLPEESQRREIWKRIFPASAPLADDLDIDLLARKLDLAGGHIKNIAVAAAYYAASEKRPIGMSHILRAVAREYEKLSKIFIKEEFTESITL